MTGATEPNLEALAGVLSVLGNESRLQLLRQLRRPRRLSELRIKPEAARKGESPERLVSRQAVRHHLEKLLSIEVAQFYRRGSPFAGDEFLVNHRQLFLISEQVRELARLEPADAPFQAETRAALPLARPPAAGRRALVLVHGIEEGRAWPLELGRTLTVGRAKAADVRLDYDPFVSSRHVEVAAGAAEVAVTDLGSRNGTLLNWRPLASGERRPLAPGDVLGVGRSSLVYRP